MKLTERLQERVDDIVFEYGGRGRTGENTGITATVHQRGDEFVIVHRKPDGRQFGKPDMLGDFVQAMAQVSPLPTPVTAFQIGDLTHFRLDDPRLDDPVVTSLNQALECALDMSGISEDPRAGVVGIWSSQEEGSELLFIAFGGELFKKC